MASVIKPADLDPRQTRAIASLSDKLRLPFSDVRRAYLQELDALQAQARIRGFLQPLAFNRTRSILRCRKRPPPGK
jgi:hypothetical protein